MLKVINAICWIAAAFVSLAAIYGASIAYSQELITPRPDTHPEISRGITRMCVNAEDAYELAGQDAKEGKMDWQAKIQAGKCAIVRLPLVFYRVLEEYEDTDGKPGFVVEVLWAGKPGVHLYTVLSKIPVYLSQITYKNEYANNPPPVSAWFKEAHVKGACDASGRAWLELQICGCCEFADRLHTKFVGEKGKEWSYYPDPNCTTRGCKLEPIPVHA